MGLETVYRGKRVLVTGHTGFKGGWLSLWLHKMGAQVIGFSNPPSTDPSFYGSCNIGNITTDLIGDIRDVEDITTAIQGHRPDFIFHLAAQPIVRTSYENPVDTFSTNVMGTINVLEAIRNSEHKAVCVFITSDKCYENKEWEYAYRENDKLGGKDPYSASKAMAEMAVNAYRQSYFGLPTSHYAVATARAGNVIGGGDWSTDRIVPDCVRSLHQNEQIMLRNFRAIRPWQHVLDVLNGYLKLAAHMKIFMKEDSQKYAGAWNFGPDAENCISVMELAHNMRDCWDSNVIIDNIDNKIEDEKKEATYLKLDSSKSRSALRWKPKYDVEKSVEKTVEWYKAHYNGENMKSFSINQINEWQNL
jgi:CDP-glucose 4,6-dehydratase